MLKMFFSFMSPWGQETEMYPKSTISIQEILGHFQFETVQTGLSPVCLTNLNNINKRPDEE